MMLGIDEILTRFYFVYIRNVNEHSFVKITQNRFSIKNLEWNMETNQITEKCKEVRFYTL